MDRNVVQESVLKLHKAAVGFPGDRRRWVRGVFFCFLCLLFQSCYQTPTTSHLYLWQKTPPTRTRRKAKAPHLTVTRVKQTLPLHSRLLSDSKQTLWLFGTSESLHTRLSGVLHVSKVWNRNLEEKTQFPDVQEYTIRHQTYTHIL